MDRMQIEKLEELLEKHIDNKKIVNSKISRLTAPGDNYGALLLKVDLILKSKDGDPEQLNVVAKCIPVSTFLQDLFNIQVSVKKEIAFYDTILPELQKFQKDQGIKNVMDFFPRMYGARLNLNGSDVVDEHSVIILENLVQSGYENLDRLVGFDLDTTKLILKDLATFHAVPLALKLFKPDVFQKKIAPHLPEFKEVDPNGPSERPNGPSPIIKSFLETCEEIHALLPSLRKIDFQHLQKKQRTDGPFFTVTHGDMWLNNIMVKLENNKVVASKIVDFQNYSLRSPAVDLLLLLSTSIRPSLLEHNLDDLIKFYYDSFIENLKRLKCDISAFPFDKFLDELRIESKSSLGQAVFMTTYVIFGKKEGFANELGPVKVPNYGTHNFTREAEEKVLLIIKKWNEKGWL